MSLLKQTSRLVAVAALLTAMMATPAFANSGVVSSFEFGEGLFYGDGVLGPVILLAGVNIEEDCMDQQHADDTGMARVLPTGDYQETARVDNVEMRLYDSGGQPAPVWLQAACDNVINGGDAPVPLAEGEGRVTFQLRTAGDTVYIHNASRGSVVTPEGETLQVRGWANLSVGPEGLDLEKVSLVIAPGS